MPRNLPRKPLATSGAAIGIRGANCVTWRRWRWHQPQDDKRGTRLHEETRPGFSQPAPTDGPRIAFSLTPWRDQNLTPSWRYYWISAFAFVLLFNLPLKPCLARGSGDARCWRHRLGDARGSIQSWADEEVAGEADTTSHADRGDKKEESSLDWHRVL